MLNLYLAGRFSGGCLSPRLTLSQTTLVLTCLQYKSVENTMGKGEIVHNEQFLLFPTVFSMLFDAFLPFSSTSILLPAKSISLEESKICCLGKGESDSSEPVPWVRIHQPFSGSVFTNHSQEHSLTFSQRFAYWNATQFLIG